MRHSRALIKVGYACNNHCTFCHTLDHREVMASSETILRKVDRAAELGHAMVVFSGGEPTIRRELTDWSRRARDHGMGVGLVTNGRMLAYPGLIERLLAHGLAYVHLSFHSGSAGAHDAVTRAPSWQQTHQALLNLSGRGLELTAACVLTRDNLDQGRGVIDSLASLDGVIIKFSMVEPKGAARALFDEVVPSVTDAARAAADALAYGREHLPDSRLAHEGFPLCLLEGVEHLTTGLRDHGFVHMTEADESDFFPIDDNNKMHPPVCNDCAIRGRCPGLFCGYAERCGVDEVGPARRGPRSNSFNYEPNSAFTWEPGTSCPVLTSGPTRFDRARTMFVRQGAHMQVARTSTRDFTDADLVCTKVERGQIYVDSGDQPAVGNFETDLARLSVLAECRACPAFERCPGCYQRDPINPFVRDRERLRDRLTELRGDVLDIGCGSGRYAAALEPAAIRGELRYVGVDPNADALARFAADHPWAELECAQVEVMTFETSSWDHILLLNSYNHVDSPERLVAELARALRPGGTLLVADDVPYGLVRTTAQARRAEAGTARFEHQRNHAAAEAAEVVRRYLDVTFVEEVSAGSSNQWYVKGVKSGES